MVPNCRPHEKFPMFSISRIADDRHRESSFSRQLGFCEVVPCCLPRGYCVQFVSQVGFWPAAP